MPGKITAKQQQILDYIKEGIEKGIEKGKEEEKLNIARQMKANGIPTHTIAACTGLDTEEINRL